MPEDPQDQPAADSRTTEHLATLDHIITTAMDVVYRGYPLGPAIDAATATMVDLAAAAGPNPAAGRTPRPLDRLQTMLKERGWRLSSLQGDSEYWRHPDSPGEYLRVARPYADAYDAAYDAALARLAPMPTTDTRTAAVARLLADDALIADAAACLDEAARLIAAADRVDPVRAWLRGILLAGEDGHPEGRTDRPQRSAGSSE